MNKPMPKTILSILLTMIFALLLAAPTVISIVDSDVDTSVFYSMAEEENSKETVKLVELELKAHQGLNHIIGLSELDNTFGFYLNIYSQFELESVSPPPKINIV